MMLRLTVLSLLAAVSAAPLASALYVPGVGEVVVGHPCTPEDPVQVHCEMKECSNPYAPYVYWQECHTYTCDVYTPVTNWCIIT